MKKLLKKEWEKTRTKHENRTQFRVFWTFLYRLLELIINYLSGRFYFRKANTLGTLVFAKQAPKVSNQGQLAIGNLVRVWSNIYPSQFFIGQEGRLSIGDHSYINGALISVESEVRIGKNCYLAPMVQVIDSDYFGLGEVDGGSMAKAIIIEEDAWLATRCMITKGVHIGKGAVVAVGAVVTEDVAPYTVVAGAPAKVIKHLRSGT